VRQRELSRRLKVRLNKLKNKSEFTKAIITKSATPIRHGPSNKAGLTKAITITISTTKKAFRANKLARRGADFLLKEIEKGQVTGRRIGKLAGLH
jgi:hypothetical protein